MRIVPSFVAVVAGLSAVLGAVPAPAQSVWEIDPVHSSVQFTIRHMMVSNVRGEFTKVAGTVRADDKDPTRSTVEATLEAASIDTRNAKRDEHLRSPDFFDVAKFPTITFKSKRVERAGEGRYKVIGDLTMHGVTKEVTLDVEAAPPVKDLQGHTRAGAHATTRVNRQDFGIVWSKTLDGGGVALGDQVDVTIDVEALKAQ
ncbi:MAG TPA: YceI family protein [Candidatus Binatia bacterium]|nr:YceI family protein [Candidatus Binatia bacterium]